MHFPPTRATARNRTLIAGLACTAIIAASLLAAPTSAFGVTAAEKQAEADAVFTQIDSLQTSLNRVMAERERAQAATEQAYAARDEAERQAQAQSEHIDELQSELAQFAVGIYKNGGSTSFLDVMLDATSFSDFVSSWDACNSVFARGGNLVDEARSARAAYREKQAEYDAQGQRAEEEQAAAEAAQSEIEQTQEALRAEAQKLSEEAAELQVQEELAAEAARQAEEARKQREAELAAAAQAAAEAEARAQAAAEAEAQAEAESEAEAQLQDGAETGDEDAGDPEEAPRLEQDLAEAAAPQETFVLGAGYLTNPCPSATSSSGFGYRTFDNSFHKGLDMSAPEGTPYYAADSGTVMFATNDGGYNGGAGNWVVISHGHGVVTKYMHSSATYVSPGDYVERGQNIGAVGNTGQSFGAHLHFQVEVDGVAVNPLNYL